MHVPDVARTIGELTRVAKPGGFVVLGEMNQNAPDADSPWGQTDLEFIFRPRTGT